LLVRAGLYLSLGLVFGMLAFTRSNSYRRRTGASPFHIHPLVWGGLSAFAAFVVTLFSILFVAMVGTVLSVVTWSPRLSSGRRQAGADVSGYEHLPVRSSRSQPARPPQLQAPVDLTAWLSDPTGRNELRYFDGSGWTEYVANAGVISADRL
jgi:hypothetical protein